MLGLFFWLCRVCPAATSTVSSQYRIKNLRGRIVVVTPTIVLDLILAFRRSKAMFAAVKPGIFDHSLMNQD
jgi:hypothetical protein